MPYVQDCYTIWPRRSDPVFLVTNYIKWDTTSWTHSSFLMVRREYLGEKIQKCKLNTMKPLHYFQKKDF